MPIVNNPHLVRAYKDYMDAKSLVRKGLRNNANCQANFLRSVYRIIAGKV